MYVLFSLSPSFSPSFPFSLCICIITIYINLHRTRAAVQVCNTGPELFKGYIRAHSSDTLFSER